MQKYVALIDEVLENRIQEEWFEFCDDLAAINIPFNLSTK